MASKEVADASSNSDSKDPFWTRNPNPKHLTVPAHGCCVVTVLIIFKGRVITASDDNTIQVRSLETGELIHDLKGHSGGVWSLKATNNRTLISGSTDRTIRVWDLETGECTHIFGGHQSTVRAMAVVEPEIVDVEDENGAVRKEKWPKRTLLVSGSRDHTLRVWTVPKAGDPTYFPLGDEDEWEEADVDRQNPYHRLVLTGHMHAVRDVDARGRTAVSGSYDTNVKVWDIITGTCLFSFSGHSEKVYAVALDLQSRQVFSSGLDSIVRVWQLDSSKAEHDILRGHSSMIGLIALSPSHKTLVSGSADSTLRIWNAEGGELQGVAVGHEDAISSFQHDDSKIISGATGKVKMWNTHDGTFIRDLLTGVVSVWCVRFEGQWCVSASNRDDFTMLDIWDFGLGYDNHDEHEDGRGDWEDEGDEDKDANQKIAAYGATVKVD
ncbi:cell division control protein 4 [Coprinopsis marcescibilis]|uniref:Cell division control protein 4 n=1 Tax=Coprinopsis marcescibilis TaxID=230819 RepID=A0A5C3LC93_COPMA|nr:cell division control protein 4 [Coprinopsis marcescibilis]